MKTVKVLFTADAKFETSPETIYYRAGDVHELREDHAGRWVKRGVATEDVEAIAAAEAPKVQPQESLPEGVPDGWRSLNAADTVALAVSLGAAAESVRFKAQAVEFIDSKILEYRAASE